MAEAAFVVDVADGDDVAAAGCAHDLWGVVDVDIAAGRNLHDKTGEVASGAAVVVALVAA